MFNDIDIDVNFFDSNYEGLQYGRSECNYFNTTRFNEDNSLAINNKNLCAIHVNIRSLTSNGDTFIAYLDTLKLKFDIICFSETWLRKDNQIENYFPDYTSFHSMRTDRNGGGVSIFISNKYKSSQLVDITCNSDHLECIFANLTYGDKTVIVGSCYRPPIVTNYHAFISDLSSKLSVIDSNCLTLICGDFNLDLLKMDSDSTVSNFMDTIHTFGLIHTISKPTRITENTFSLIDNIFISNSAQYSSGILSFDITDHFPIFVVFKNFFDRAESNQIIEYRLLNENTLNNLTNNFSSESFDNILNSDDIDFCIEELDKKILTAYNKYCPILKKRITKKDREKPWITSRIKRLIKNRQNYFYQYKSTFITFVQFKRYRNYVSREIVLSKKQYYRDLLNGVKNDMKKTWNVINGILRPNRNRKNCNIKTILSQGTVLDNNVAISNVFNQHFSTIGSIISDTFPPTNHESVSNVNIHQSIFFRHVSAIEVSNIINGLKNKSCHISSYSSRVLKQICSIISPVLSNIINKSLCTGYFPNSLKTARVIPLHKSGSEDDVNNYRPVSILPILSKLFERIVYNRVYSFLEKYNLLNHSQYGFRKGKSTIQAVMDQLEYVYRNIDSGNVVVSFFIDFSKAFDCIDHDILLKKLDHHGIRGIPKRWFQSYLSDRKQYVSVNNTSSSILPLSHGVPQGSILGPLLFLIFINDFPNCSDFFKFNLFADDSTLTCKFDSFDENYVKQTLENELKPVEHWLNMNKIKINCSKSKFIIFSYRKNFSLHSITFGNNIISVTNSIKFLGIEIDRNLNFRTHVNNISKKVSRVIGLLFRLNKFLPVEILKTLYFTLVMPHIMYGIEVWYGAPQYVLDRISILQKKAIRAINSLPYNDHTHEYFKSMKLLKIHDLYKVKILSHMFIHFDRSNYTSQSEIHSHNTRNRGNITTPFFNRSRSQSTWLYQGVHLWNSVPDEIKSSLTMISFKNSIKNMLVMLY